MGVEVLQADGKRVLLSAPLAPNLNHRRTVFGGSAAAVAILAAWSLVHLRLVALGLPSRLVIQHNAMDYLTPIDGAFHALCEFDDEDAWRRFVALLTRRRKARIRMTALLEHRGGVAGRFEGDFVAFLQ